MGRPAIGLEPVLKGRFFSHLVREAAENEGLDYAWLLQTLQELCMAERSLQGWSVLPSTILLGPRLYGSLEWLQQADCQLVEVLSEGLRVGGCNPGEPLRTVASLKLEQPTQPSLSSTQLCTHKQHIKSSSWQYEKPKEMWNLQSLSSVLQQLYTCHVVHFAGYDSCNAFEGLKRLLRRTGGAGSTTG